MRGGPFGATSDSTTQYVRVTVQWQFNSITNFPGVPTAVTLSQAVVMKIAPATPNF